MESETIVEMNNSGGSSSSSPHKRIKRFLHRGNRQESANTVQADFIPVVEIPTIFSEDQRTQILKVGQELQTVCSSNHLPQPTQAPFLRRWLPQVNLVSSFCL